jgi:thiopeptide-type bacteriocin biosynthesis protein
MPLDQLTCGEPTALGDIGGTGWTQISLSFPDDAATRRRSRLAVAHLLDELGGSGAHDGWWFMNKPPGWRLRIHDAQQPAVVRELDRLHDNGTITAWTRTIYEPETTAFGGTQAMTLVHDLFCADTHGVLTHQQARTPRLGARETSLMLLGALTRAARLDSFETGDVFAKVAAMRPPTTASTTDLQNLADQAGRLLRIPTDSESPLLAPDGPAPHLRAWANAFATSGKQLADLADTGRHGRGLRSVLAQTVIFHWNRLALPARSQATLAAAVVQATPPGAD